MTKLEFCLISPFNDSSHGGVMHDSEMKWRINWHHAWKLSQSSGFLSCSQELRSDWRSSRALDSCSYLRQTTDAHSHDPRHSMAVSMRENQQLKCASKIKLLSHEFGTVLAGLSRGIKLQGGNSPPPASLCNSPCVRLIHLFPVCHCCIRGKTLTQQSASRPLGLCRSFSRRLQSTCLSNTDRIGMKRTEWIDLNILPLCFQFFFL